MCKWHTVCFCTLTYCLVLYSNKLFGYILLTYSFFYTLDILFGFILWHTVCVFVFLTHCRLYSDILPIILWHNVWFYTLTYCRLYSDILPGFILWQTVWFYTPSYCLVSKEETITIRRQLAFQNRNFLSCSNQMNLIELFKLIELYHFNFYMTSGWLTRKYLLILS